MKKKIHLLQLIFPALLLLGNSGCTKDDSRNGRLAANEYPIELGTKMLNITPSRSTSSNSWDGNEVVAVKVVGKEPFKQYKASADGKLSSTQPFFWSNRNEALQISAWYPVGGESDFPGSFTVKTDQSTAAAYQQSDFIYAVPREVKFADESKNLDFKHLPVRVIINFKAEGPITPDHIKRGALVLINQAEHSGAINAQTGGVEQTSGSGEVIPQEMSAQTGFDRTVQALLVPSQLQNKGFIQIKIDADTYTYIPANATDGNLESGKQYTYDVKVNLHGLTVKLTESATWIESYSEDVTTTLLPEAQSGDYYYDDDSWSSDYDDMDGTRTCIGIIFDVARDGKSGRVLALEEESYSWSQLTQIEADKGLIYIRNYGQEDKQMPELVTKRFVEGNFDFNYPAFNWVLVNKNKGNFLGPWRVPTYNDGHELFFSSKKIDEEYVTLPTYINMRLRKLPVNIKYKEFDETKTTYYWTSQENGKELNATETDVIDISFSPDNSSNPGGHFWLSDKVVVRKVRPVRSFQEPTNNIVHKYDYYYSDNTWSDTYNEEKTCIGIVLRIGKDMRSGVMIGVEVPGANWDGNNPEGKLAWSTSNDQIPYDTFSDDGLQSTLGMFQYRSYSLDTYPIFKWSFEFTKANSKTGKIWFVPSPAEVITLLTLPDMEEIASRIKRIDPAGRTLINPQTWEKDIWTSAAQNNNTGSSFNITRHPLPLITQEPKSTPKYCLLMAHF